MDISEIKDLINAISNSKIDIFDYEENGAKLHLEKKTEVEVIASPKPVAQDVLVKQENTEESIEQKEVLTGNVINSPLVGTVYPVSYTHLLRWLMNFLSREKIISSL